MAITAKVRCNSRLQVSEECDVVSFSANYQDGANKDWAYFTPALHIQMNVRRDVPFESGKDYMLTFEQE
jgi:hypothetical protein